MAPSLCAAVTQVPSAYISWPEAVRGSLPTQGGRDVPPCTVGSHQLGRQRCPPPLRSTEHGAHKTAKTERLGARAMQRSHACGPVLPGQASPPPHNEQRQQGLPPLSCAVRGPRWDQLGGPGPMAGAPVESSDAPKPPAELLGPRGCQTGAEGRKEHRARPLPRPRRRAGPRGPPTTKPAKPEATR